AGRRGGRAVVGLGGVTVRLRRVRLVGFGRRRVRVGHLGCSGPGGRGRVISIIVVTAARGEQRDQEGDQKEIAYELHSYSCSVEGTRTNDSSRGGLPHQAGNDTGLGVGYQPDAACSPNSVSSSRRTALGIAKPWASSGKVPARTAEANAAKASRMTVETSA